MAWILALPKGRSAGSSEALLVPEFVSTLGPSVRAGLNAKLCYQVEAIVASYVRCNDTFRQCTTQKGVGFSISPWNALRWYPLLLTELGTGLTQLYC